MLTGCWDSVVPMPRSVRARCPALARPMHEEDKLFRADTWQCRRRFVTMVAPYRTMKEVPHVEDPTVEYECLVNVRMRRPVRPGLLTLLSTSALR
jgi:hypothetical protein